MHCGSAKRKAVDASPWERDIKPKLCTPEELRHMMQCSMNRSMFHKCAENLHLDSYTKMAALKVSASVVSLISYSGEDQIYQTSGTIIEDDDNCGIILTSATLLKCPTGQNSIADSAKVVVHLSDQKSFEGQIMAVDFHYNIATIKIQFDAPLQVACLENLDDSFTIDPSWLHTHEEKSFQPRPSSKSYNLIPGNAVIALGRYFVKPNALMAAPGKFRYDCKELFRASCKITRCGIGGPLINCYGEVIGICFNDPSYMPFLPINIASIWWDHYKKYGEPRRPLLGLEIANLYAAPLCFLDKFIQKSPSIFKGIIVEEVEDTLCNMERASCGISNDVIVQCGIQSFLKLFENMWSKVGDQVELVVIRASDDDPLHLSMVVDEATVDRLYSWPLWEHAN